MVIGQVALQKDCSSLYPLPVVFEYYTHNAHPIHMFHCIQLSQPCEVAFVILIFPSSCREQSWISSDHYRALPDPLRAHCQDYQSGVEPTPWRKAGICFLWWHSSGTVASLGVGSSLCTLTVLFSPVVCVPLPSLLSSTERDFLSSRRHLSFIPGPCRALIGLLFFI